MLLRLALYIGKSCKEFMYSPRGYTLRATSDVSQFFNVNCSLPLILIMSSDGESMNILDVDFHDEVNPNDVNMCCNSEWMSPMQSENYESRKTK